MSFNKEHKIIFESLAPSLQALFKLQNTITLSDDFKTYCKDSQDIKLNITDSHINSDDDFHICTIETGKFTVSVNGTTYTSFSMFDPPSQLKNNVFLYDSTHNKLYFFHDKDNIYLIRGGKLQAGSTRYSGSEYGREGYILKADITNKEFLYASIYYTGVICVNSTELANAKTSYVSSSHKNITSSNISDDDARIFDFANNCRWYYYNDTKTWNSVAFSASNITMNYSYFYDTSKSRLFFYKNKKYSQVYA